MVQVQVEELAEDHLAQLSVLLQDELIVEARDQDDVLQPGGHQHLEILESAAVAQVGEQLVDGRHLFPRLLVSRLAAAVGTAVRP